MKIATYRNPSYCLSFGGDCVFLEVEIEITRLHEQKKEFSCSIINCSLKQGDEDFPAFVLTFLNLSALVNLNAAIRQLLKDEITPQLFSLFYSCTEIRDSKDDNTAA